MTTCSRHGYFWLQDRIDYFSVVAEPLILQAIEQGADCPQRSKVFRDNEFSRWQIENAFKGAHHANIGGDSALKGNWPFKNFTPANGSHKITRYGLTKTGNNILVGSPFLLQMNHVGFGKDGTAAGDARGLF